MAEDYIQSAKPTLSPDQFGLDPASLAPTSPEELSRQSERFEQGRLHVETDAPSEEMVRLGKRLGVPLESGIDTADYLAYKARATPEEQVNWLAQRFGAENIRFNPMGKPVIQTFDPKSGKPIDRTVDPFDIEPKSVAGFAIENAAPMLATAAALKGGNPAAIASRLQKVPLLGRMLGGGATTLGKAIIGSSAFEAAKAAQGMGVRAYDKPPIDLDSIGYNVKEDISQAVKGAAMVPVDVLGEMAMVKGGEATRWAHSLMTGQPVPTPVEAGIRTIQNVSRKFAKETEASELGREGMAFWEKEAKAKGQPELKAKPTFGMVTDIPFFAKAWGYMTKHAAGASAGEAAKAAWDESLRAQQRYMLSQGNLRALEDIGRDGLMALKPAYDAAEQSLARETATTKGAIQDSIQKRVLDLFNAQTLPKMGYPFVETGAYLNSSASKTRDVWWGKVADLYNQVYSHPAAAQRFDSPSSFISRLKQIKSELPSTENRVSEIGFDAYGSPIEITKTEQEPLKEFVPEGVLSKLNGLLKTEGGTTSIADLKAIRTEINNSIKRSQATPGVKDHFLGEMASAVDDALQNGIDTIGDPQLRSAWNAAVGEYKGGIGKFKNKLLAKMWAHPEEVAVDNGALFNSIENSPGRYQAVKDFFGNDGEGTRAFRQSVVKRMLSDSLADGSATTVNLPTLISQAKALASKNGQLFRDIFGADASKFQRLEVEGGLTKALEGDVDVSALHDLVNGKVPNAQQFRKLIQVEKTRKKLYQNQVVQPFVRGEQGISTLEPEEFVRNLSESNLSDVSKVMTTLENSGQQKYIEDVRVKVLQSMFRKAQRQATAEDYARMTKGDPTFLVSTEGLNKVMGTDEQKAVYQRVLGPEQWTRLENYLKETLLEKQYLERASQAGFIASASSTSAGIKGVLEPTTKGASELSNFAKYKLLALMMSRPAGVKALSSLGKPLPPPIIGQGPLPQNAMAALLTSGQFLDALAREFTDPMTRFQVQTWLKRHAGLATTEPEQPNQPQP